MSRDAPDRPPAAALIEALNVRRNARRGFAFGAALAVVVYAYFVAIPLFVAAVPARDRSPLLFLMLAFVVAVTTGLLATTALTVKRAATLSRDIHDRDDGAVEQRADRPAPDTEDGTARTDPDAEE